MKAYIWQQLRRWIWFWTGTVLLGGSLSMENHIHLSDRVYATVVCFIVLIFARVMAEL